MRVGLLRALALMASLPACGDGEGTVDGAVDGGLTDAPIADGNAPDRRTSRDGGADAGTDGGPVEVDAGPPPLGEPEPPCGYACASVGFGMPVRELTVAPGGSRLHNVTISAGTRTRFGTMFSIIANDCCGTTGAPDHIGAVVHVGPADAAALVVFGPEPRVTVEFMTPVFHASDRPALMHSNGNYMEVRIIDEEALAPLSTIDTSALEIRSGPLMAPSFATREGGLVVLQGTDVRVRPLGPMLAPAGDPVSFATTARAHRGAIVRTCSGGLVALVLDEEGVLYRLQLGPDGVPLEAALTEVATGMGRFSTALHALWDGMHIVVVGDGKVVELDADGEPAGETPTAPVVHAAVGTGDGLLVLESDGDSRPEIRVRERITGIAVRYLGSLDVGALGASSAGMGLDRDRIDVAATSYLLRDRVRVQSFSCEPP